MEPKSSSAPNQAVLITGGTGFIGSNLIRRLLQEKALVHLLVRQTSRRQNLDEISHLIRWHMTDLTDYSRVLRVVQEVQPAMVFHIAGSSFNHPPTTDVFEHAQVNVMGTLTLLEALKNAAPDARLIFAGSAAEYGAGTDLSEDQLPVPATLLGATKVAATNLIQMYARLYGLQTTVIRIFTPFGPYEQPKRLIPHAILSALKKEEVLLTDGRQGRDFLYIDDLVEAMRCAGQVNTPPGSVINICSGKSTRIVEIVQKILDLMGNPVGFRTGALPTRKDEIWDVSGGCLKAKELLGWEPTTELEVGLSKAIDWWRLRLGAETVYV